MTSQEPLRVAVLASWRADGLDGLLAGDGRYEVVAGVITEPCSPVAGLLDRHQVPRVLRDLRGFCLRRGVSLSDPEARCLFDAQTANWLRRFRPDLIVLCGYSYRLAEPILAAWPHRVIGVHDADLRLRNAGGGPRYPGLRAVRDAVCAGESETRSTVYLVALELDAGPPLVVSGPYPVSVPADVRRSEEGIGTYIAVHRERMIKECWGSLLREAVELFCEERIEITVDGRAFIDGHPAPFPLSAQRTQIDPFQAVS